MEQYNNNIYSSIQYLSVLECYEDTKHEMRVSTHLTHVFYVYLFGTV